MVGSTDEGAYTVQLTSSPGRYIERQYDPSEIRRAVLDPQTRVHYRNEVEDKWQYGRVISHSVNPSTGELEYEVQFPNSEYKRLSEKEVDVRSFTSSISPAEFFESQSLETKF